MIHPGTHRRFLPSCARLGRALGILLLGVGLLAAGAARADVFDPLGGSGPNGNLILNSGILSFDTSSTALTMSINAVQTATATYESGAAVFRFNNVNIGASVVTIVSGTQPLIILSANDMIIDNNFDVSGTTVVTRRAGAGWGGAGGLATKVGWPGSLGFGQAVGFGAGGALQTVGGTAFSLSNAGDLTIAAGSGGGGGGGGNVTGKGGKGGNGGGAIVLGARGLLRYNGTTDISAGASTAPTGTAGAGGYGNPGMIKLMGSVILGSAGKVTPSRVANPSGPFNGRVTLISNLATPASYQPTKSGSDPLATIVYGYTTHNPVLTSTSPFDTATNHPYIGELSGGAATRGVFAGTYWNQSLVTHPGTFRVEMVRLTGSNTPFTGYDQVFIKNNTGAALGGLRLKVGTNAAVLLPGSGPAGQLTAGQIFTTTVATGVAATIDELISYDPLLDQLSADGDATFEVTNAVGGGVIDYQWQQNDGNGWVDLPGEVSAALNLTGIDGTMDGWLYRCELTDNTHAIFTNAATLDVELLVSGIVPAVMNLRQNESSQFVVMAIGGTAPYTYEWFKDGNPLVDGGTVSGATSDTLSLSAVSTADAGVYECVVSDSATVPDSVSATMAVLNVYPALQATLTANAFQGVIGGSASIGVIATGGVPPLSYQWRRDRGLGFVSLFEQDPFTGTNGTVLNIDPLIAQDDLDLFRVVVSDAGSDVSGPASVTAGDAILYIGSPLSIVTHPVGRALYNTEPPFSISTSFTGGVGTVTYAWFRRDVDTLVVTPLNSGTVSGSLISLVIDPANPGNGHYEYYCVVQDPTSSAQTNNARVDIGSPIEITLTTPDIVPDGQGGYELMKNREDTILFSADVTGGLGSLSYQWLKETGSKALVPLVDNGGISGTNTPAMTIAMANTVDNGTYYLAVSDDVGETLSAPTTLSVDPGLPVAGFGGLAVLVSAISGLGVAFGRRRRH